MQNLFTLRTISSDTTKEKRISFSRVWIYVQSVKSDTKSSSGNSGNIFSGPVCFRVREAYPRKKRNKPAKQRAFDALISPAGLQFKRDLYCVLENRVKRAAGRVGLLCARVSQRQSQTGSKLRGRSK